MRQGKNRSSVCLGDSVEITDKVREDDGEKQELVLTITATAEEVDASADLFFKQIAQNDIPGFRKGKAPRAVLEQSVGGHNRAMGGVAEALINEFAFKVIDDAGVIFISEPQFNVDGVIEEGKPFSFTVSGAVAPVMKLTSYDPVSIEMPPEKATEAEIEGQLRELQDYYHSFEVIDDPDYFTVMGDYVDAAVTVTNHGRLVSGLGNANRMIGLGEGTMPESFDEHLVGTKIGDQLEFDFEAKGEDGSSAFGDGELHAIVEIKGIRKIVLPEIDDELAVKVGCADAADMRKQLEYTINVQKSKDLPRLMVDRAVEKLIDRLDGEVPAYYVDFIRQDVGREFMKHLDEQGTSLQEWLIEGGVSGDQMKEDVSREAERRAAIDCALEALFVEKGLEVTEEDVDKMFEGEDAAEGTRESWEQSYRMANIRKMCRQSKATQWLVDNAEVTVVDEADGRE